VKKRGPFSVLSTKTVYQNPWITVNEDEVIRPNGAPGIFGTIDYGRGISVVALTQHNTVLLVREFFYVLDTYGLLVPSGNLDKNESALDAAKRELLEEAGAQAATWSQLGPVDPLTMIIKSPVQLFLAQGATIIQPPEDDLRLVEVPFDEAHTMALTGTITHAPSCVAILRAKAYLDNPAQFNQSRQ
jgi:8-oxo-dGTP pyrophosphatase MutT (NUDIX family)